MAGARIVDRDKGYKRLMNTLLKAAGETEVTIGFHSDVAGETMKVASINEFGGSEGNPPERSMIRAWSDESEGRNLELLRNAATLVLKQGKPWRTVLKQVVAIMVGEVQARIASGIPPANAPSTVARKGSSTPLINTGQMRASIAGKIDGA